MGVKQAIIYGALNLFGGFIYSYNNSIISGISKSLVQCTFFNEGEVNVSTYQSILTAAILIGATIGAPLGTWACSSLSRKIAAYIVSIVGIIVPLITLLWENYYYICVMRLLVGIAMGMAASIFPLYTVEITEMKYKSTVGSIFGVAVGAGVIVAQCVNLLTPKFEDGCVPIPSWNWRIQLGLASLWGVITIILISFSPDSPIDIEKREKKDQSNKQSELSSTTTDSTIPIKSEETNNENEQKEKKEILHTSIFHYTNFKWFIYSIIQPAFSNITGVYIFIYYAPIIFQSAGISDVLVIQIVLVGCTMTVCSIISSFVVAKLSRLLLLKITSFILIVGTAIVITSFAITDNKALTVPLAVIGTLIFLIGFGFGPACLYYVSLVQDFPPHLKTNGIGFANIIRYILNAALTFSFPIILSNNGPVIAFTILIIIQIIIFIYCLFFYPVKEEKKTKKTTSQTSPIPTKIIETEIKQNIKEIPV